MNWKPNNFILGLVVPLLTAGWVCGAAVPGDGREPFDRIVERNIFDPGRGLLPKEPPKAPEEVITFNGTLSYDGQTYAFFGGRSFRIGDRVGGCQIADVSHGSVRLAAGGEEMYILSVGMRLRREGDGPWQVLDGAGEAIGKVIEQRLHDFSK
jgi:hypothetical protein